MPETSAAPPKLEIDYDLYASYFEDENISEADKRELLDSLWSIICSFVQMGWGVHPVQQAQDSRNFAKIACGQISENGEP